MEHEINELKRSLYDCKERELDLRDQLKFLEADNRKMMKNVSLFRCLFACVCMCERAFICNKSRLRNNVVSLAFRYKC